MQHFWRGESSNLFLPIGKSASSGCFQDFFLCLGVDFFGLSHLGFLQLLRSIDLCLLPNLRAIISNFSHYLFEYFLSFLDSSDISIRSLLMVLQVADALFLSLFSVFQIGFLLFYLQLTDPFTSLLHSAVEPDH